MKGLKSINKYDYTYAVELSYDGTVNMTENDICTNVVGVNVDCSATVKDNGILAG